MPYIPLSKTVMLCPSNKLVQIHDLRIAVQHVGVYFIVSHVPNKVTMRSVILGLNKIERCCMERIILLQLIPIL